MGEAEGAGQRGRGRWPGRALGTLRARASGLGAGEEQPPLRSAARTRKEPRLPPRGRSSAASGDGYLRESRWTPRRLPSRSHWQGPDGRVRPPPTLPLARGSPGPRLRPQSGSPRTEKGWRPSAAQAAFDPLPARLPRG